MKVPFAGGGGPQMERILAEAEHLAASDTPVVLLGETGVGKEWLARRIHQLGSRADQPFVAVNCAAVPESLFESELFGHERGAFTGADRPRRGHFEQADGGTLFLDEVAETPLHLQARLLRAVEAGQVQRLGSESPVAVDVRIVAATNRDLATEMAEGRFRKDLFYRLAVSTLTIPPLRHRRDEIASLAKELLGRTPRAGRVDGFTEEALQALNGYDWPGNVRELAGVVERAAQLAQGRHITAEELPLRVVVAGRAPGRVLATVLHWPEGSWLDRPLPEVRDELVATLEREYLQAQLRRAGGDLAETARRSGISSRTLYSRMQELGLERRDFRSEEAEEETPAQTRPPRRRSEERGSG